MAAGYESATPARRRAPGRACRLFAAVLLLALVPGAGATALSGDAAQGRLIYERCQACHSLQRHRSGPKHCGLIGRAAGSLDGYGYSDALRGSGIVWTKESLDRFLENPFKAVPGTRMGYAGVKDPRERADLIAFLAAAGPCDP